MNFIIKNIDLITDVQKSIIKKNAHISINNGIITEISDTDLSKKYPDYKIVNGQDRLLIPGMVNAHTHVSMSLFRGVGEGLRDRLTKFFFPLEKKAVSKELVYLAAIYGIGEMLSQGITAFCDMYYFEDKVGKAAELLGIRGLIGQTILNFPAPDSPLPYGGLDLANCSAELWQNHPLVSFAYAPHAPYTVEPQILKEIIACADKTKAQFSMHVAEFEDEKERIRAISDIKEKESIITYLERHQILREDSLFAHMIFVSDQDIQILKNHNIHIAHCPLANAKSGKGIAPIYDYKNAGLTIGLGTDGPLSGNRLGLKDVLSYTYSMAKLRSGDPTHLSPSDVFYAASKGGYDALSIPNGGEIREGAKADFSMVDKNDIGMTPNYEPICNLVLSVSDRAFLCTWVNGVEVAQNGIPALCDWELYRKEINKLQDSITEIVRSL